MKEEIKLQVEELEERIAPSNPPGQLGYEGQPGNQGNGQGGGGRPGNQAAANSLTQTSRTIALDDAPARSAKRACHHISTVAL
jgi:hypothetical protein